MAKEFDGKGLTPFDPYHNSSYVVAGKWNNIVCWKKMIVLSSVDNSSPIEDLF